MPFRDIEGAVGTFTLLGAFRRLHALLAASGDTDEAAASLSAIIALTAVFANAAEAVIAALDAQRLSDEAATRVGLHVPATHLLQRARTHQATFGSDNAASHELVADPDALLSVARGPRGAPQARLARA